MSSDAGRRGEFCQRRAERAQRCYLRAIQALATVRRLLHPAVPVTIAEHQINVATEGHRASTARPVTDGAVPPKDSSRNKVVKLSDWS